MANLLRLHINIKSSLLWTAELHPLCLVVVSCNPYFAVRFATEEAEKAPGFTTELRIHRKPETEEYGIRSVVYSACRPFHPKRLYSAIYTHWTSDSSPPMTSECLGNAVHKATEENVVGTGSFLNRVLRSKGFFYLAHEPDAMLEWSTAGRSVSFCVGGRWLCSMIPKDLWPLRESPDWDRTWGDR